MSDFMSQMKETMGHATEQTRMVIDKLSTVAQPGSVYSEPIQAENYTVINASEVTMVLWSGSGMGGGTADQDEKPQGAMGPGASADSAPKGPASGGGGGAGGGGFAAGRPVATVVIGPQGVQVTPIVDRTKIAIAMFTTLGAMLLTFGRMRRGSRQYWKMMARSAAERSGKS